MRTRELVCVIDPIHPAGMERIGASHELIGPEGWTDDPRLEQATIIVIRTTQIGDALFARMPRLKAIVKHGAGVDNIDIPAATRRRVLVANTPGGENSTAVAEGAVALMLALRRRVREMDAMVREGRFEERWKIRLGDLTGSRVGLVGFGRIARCVAQICGAGFGCAIAAYDPFLSAEQIRAGGAEPADLPAVMRCDVVSIHVPLTETTRDLIGARELGHMQPHGIIINCARGGIVNEEALVAALANGSIAGAGIDVFLQEPPPADHPLFSLPNVILSPHVAGVTEAGMKGMALHVAEVIDILSAGGLPATLLNPEVC
ncbi:MAG: hydroxyacid dehydrogenase [Novosphingobium sp.]|nr:hydroxyacid dehydrogenase [Novosphingobium sp.]